MKISMLQNIEQQKTQKSAKQIQSINKEYTPINNNSTTEIFGIIKYCLKNGLNYNKFFSKNMRFVLSELAKHAPDLRPKKLK